MEFPFDNKKKQESLRVFFDVYSFLRMKSFPHYIRDVGRPYQWAQRLAGLQFLKDSTDPPRAETSLSAIHMEETIKQMRARVDARVALQKQLGALGKSQIIFLMVPMLH